MSKLLQFALSFFVLLVLWQLLVLNSDLQFYLSSPSEVFSVLIRDTLSWELPYDCLVTGGEAALGFLLGLTTGTLFGFALWYSPTLTKFTAPYLALLSAVPTFAMAPLIIVWFGIGFSMKVYVAAVGTFLVALSQASAGAKSVVGDEILLSKVLGASRFQTLRLVVIPTSINWVFASARMGINTALLGAFVGEFISAERGLGHYMVRAGSLYNVAGVLSGGLYLGILGLVFIAVINLIERAELKLLRRIAISKRIRIASHQTF